jgi:hypothetical protein
MAKRRCLFRVSAWALALGGSLLLASCAPVRPVVSFSVNPATPFVNEIVWFEAVSDKPESVLEWNWEFGDGATGRGRRAWHQYRSMKADDQGRPDRWKVTVTAVDDKGHTSTASEYVQIQPPTGELAGYGLKSVGSECADLGNPAASIPAHALIDYNGESVTDGWWPLSASQASYLNVKLYWILTKIREVTCTWAVYALGSDGSDLPSQVSVFGPQSHPTPDPNDPFISIYTEYVGFALEIDPTGGAFPSGWYLVVAEITSTDPVLEYRSIYDFRLRVGTPTP